MKMYFLFLVFIFASCEKNNPTSPIDNGSTVKNAIKIDGLKDQTISMNSQFGPYQIILKNAKSSIDNINFLVKSSNWRLVDNNSIVLDKHQDPATLTIYPIIGRTGTTNISLLVCDGSDCDTSNFVLTVIASDANKSYPTILNKLDQATLYAKQSELNDILGTKYSATIDDYGLLGRLVGLLKRGHSSITDPNAAVSVVKSALLKLSEFSNISDTSLLNVKQATNIDTSPQNFSDWRISFKNQSYEGIEVWNTSIFALVTDELVSLDWHHYKYIFIPQNDIISKERTKKLLVGYEIRYECWGPKKFTITGASIRTDNMTLCVFPLTKADSLELRVAWKIPIYSGSNIYPDWYFFIDILTGEIIEMFVTFVC